MEYSICLACQPLIHLKRNIDLGVLLGPGVVLSNSMTGTFPDFTISWLDDLQHLLGLFQVAGLLIRSTASRCCRGKELWHARKNIGDAKTVHVCIIVQAFLSICLLSFSDHPKDFGKLKGSENLESFFVTFLQLWKIEMSMYVKGSVLPLLIPGRLVLKYI